MLIVSGKGKRQGRDGQIWGAQDVVGEVKLSLRVIFISTLHFAMVKGGLSRFRTHTHAGIKTVYKKREDNRESLKGRRKINGGRLWSEEHLQLAWPLQDGGLCCNCPSLKGLTCMGSGSQGRLSGGGGTSPGI